MNKYSISDVSKLCNISTKALRYYDKIGLIKPKRFNSNNYRYYTDDSLFLIPIIKYYKQMGFTLDEMNQLISCSDCNIDNIMQEVFKRKMSDLFEEQKGLEIRYNSVNDWYNLILEAKSVQENQNTDVSIQFFSGDDYLYLKQSFDENIRASVINIEFTDYVEKMKANIVGPVILQFKSYQARVTGGAKETCILQKTATPCPSEKTIFIGAQPMARCYHIGSHSTIKNTYEKIATWAKLNNYSLADECYERYVIDYWTTKDSDKYVTEIMIPAKRVVTH
ncbi:MerR family transcriptional regulator [Photobacterium alginatilyticum]|uniref:MerR family transcriptional regulator n=1 Tax=Photobacterium alginatilyticum TaxID=1775171 RepID=A0ABW9YQF7_9GAMM|nr:MerR family transcriptional regulator [Photobacterium alginatilyticum]NBI56183.1 MerR family transcriptional regulator [Photobacterium alginatilyticum]